MMVKGLSVQGLRGNLPGDVCRLIDHLERHCLAPDGSLVSKFAYYDRQLGREEMLAERFNYMEAMAIYSEALSMVEAVSSVRVGEISDIEILSPQYGVKNFPQIYEFFEDKLVVAEASQRLRLPLLSKDGDIEREEIERCSSMTQSHIYDNTGTMFCSSNYQNTLRSNVSTSDTDIVDGVGGVADRFLGITPAYLLQTRIHKQSPMDPADYQKSILLEIEYRLQDKCDQLSNSFVLSASECSLSSQISSLELPERVKFLIEEVEHEEMCLSDEIHYLDRKFVEYYNVLEQILNVLIKLVKDLKLEHQHKYDELQNIWLCKRCETMSAKLRVLEHVLLLETYTKDSVPALHKIRKYLVDATEEASVAYNKAAIRLMEYHGVDPHFDSIAKRYLEVVKNLENLQWTIKEVEMDLKVLPQNDTTISY